MNWTVIIRVHFYSPMSVKFLHHDKARDILLRIGFKMIGKIIAWLGLFLGKVFAPLLRVLITEGKKQRKVKQAGYDEELQEDMENDLEKQIMEVKLYPPEIHKPSKDMSHSADGVNSELIEIPKEEKKDD